MKCEDFSSICMKYTLQVCHTTQGNIHQLLLVILVVTVHELNNWQLYELCIEEKIVDADSDTDSGHS